MIDQRDGDDGMKKTKAHPKKHANKDGNHER